MSQIIHKDLSYLVRGVLIEVHKKLGCSLSEQFYQEAITYEFENFGSKLLEDQRLPNFFRGQEVDLQVVKFPACSISPWLVAKLNDALHRVHVTLGSGFIHRVYRRALMIELKFQGVGYEDISKIQIYYKNQFLGVEDVKVIRVESEVLLAAFAVKEIHSGMVLKMIFQANVFCKKTFA